ncbi:MAG: hypothetical protein UR43_C0015G0015 [candidate division TM6 bacterium GW2011_GWF2_33_332]|nr:MAG: hypothetical protein UR43_C0015G0015 [candidate division TM6 bacterium GW2011_GWF2_33_332]
MKTKLLLLAILILFLGSCVTQRKCASKFPPQSVTETKDSIVVKDSIIYRDRDVPYKIPGDTIRKDKPIPGIPEKINISPIILENTYAIAKAWIDNSRLKMELQQKDQVITFKLDSADKVSKHWEYKYKNEKQTIVVKEKYTPKVFKVAFWLWIFVIVAGLGYVVLRLFVFKK